MQGYLETGKEAWTNDEFWFPYVVNMRHGKEKKTRLQIICEEMFHAGYPENLYLSHLLSSYDAIKRVKELLALGADPNLGDIGGFTPLIVCASNGWEGHIPMINVLLDAGVDINYKDSWGQSALFLAAYNGHHAIVKLLLERGAMADIYTKQGESPFEIAASKGYLPIMKTLIAHGATIDDDILACVIEGKGVGTPVIQYLYSIGCPKYEHVISFAASNNKPQLIRTLIRLGENPNSSRNLTPLASAVIKNYEECVIELCKGGANLELVEVGINDTPLHWAIIQRNFKIAAILCKHGANISALNQFGDSVMHSLISIATFDKSVTKEHVKELLKYVRDFKLVDRSGETIYDVATNMGLSEIAQEIRREILRRKK